MLRQREIIRFKASNNELSPKRRSVKELRETKALKCVSKAHFRCCQSLLSHFCQSVRCLFLRLLFFHRSRFYRRAKQTQRAALKLIRLQQVFSLRLSSLPRTDRDKCGIYFGAMRCSLPSVDGFSRLITHKAPRHCLSAPRLPTVKGTTCCP